MTILPDVSAGKGFLVLCSVVFGVPEYARLLDALRVLSYTTLLLLDLFKTENVRENEGLPSVFSIVVYNGGKA